MTEHGTDRYGAEYKHRNLLEELAWGVYANHSGYTTKQNGEFLNWLCLMAYKTIKGKIAEADKECKTK